MQTANIMLALGGNRSNVIPKYGVTAAEIAVLQLIHGNDSVTDVEPIGEIERTSREERARLLQTYGRMEGERFASPQVEALFPGAAARVFEELAELDLPDSYYKAVARASAPAPKPAAAKSKRQAPAKAAEPATEPAANPDDGDLDEDMPAAGNETLFT